MAQLATPEDLEASKNDPPLFPNPPELPMCYARDLKVPENLNEARRSDDSDQWEYLMDKEFRGHLDAGTFGVVYQRPDNVIDGIWVYDWKADGYGWPTRPKARLVARGDSRGQVLIT